MQLSSGFGNGCPSSVQQFGACAGRHTASAPASQPFPSSLCISSSRVYSAHTISNGYMHSATDFAPDCCVLIHLSLCKDVDKEVKLRGYSQQSFGVFLVCSDRAHFVRPMGRCIHQEHERRVRAWAVLDLLESAACMELSHICHRRAQAAFLGVSDLNQRSKWTFRACSNEPEIESELNDWQHRNPSVLKLYH